MHLWQQGCLDSQSSGIFSRTDFTGRSSLARISLEKLEVSSATTGYEQIVRPTTGCGWPCGKYFGTLNSLHRSNVNSDAISKLQSYKQSLFQKESIQTDDAEFRYDVRELVKHTGPTRLVDQLDFHFQFCVLSHFVGDSEPCYLEQLLFLLLAAHQVRYLAQNLGL